MYARGRGVTIAAHRPEKPRAGRRGFDPGNPSLIEWLHEVSTICGMCFGHGELWCPDCAGFDGCSTCGYREKVRCPECADGSWGYWL